MKKIVILSLFLIAMGAMLWAQEAKRPEGFEDAFVVETTDQMDIDVKAFMPDSGIYYTKSQTYSKSGKYRFLLTDEDVTEQSERILNKWLKESK